MMCVAQHGGLGGGVMHLHGHVQLQALGDQTCTGRDPRRMGHLAGTAGADQRRSLTIRVPCSSREIASGSAPSDSEIQIVNWALG